MKRTMQGLLWLFLLEFALLARSLEPGFLDFDNLPDTNFSCAGKVIGGYYADLETNCQMFHVCTIGQLDEPMDIRFLCLNGTVFDQETRVCERIDEVDCSKSEQFYSLNLELYGNTQPPILEESPEIEYSLDSKKTPTTVASTSTVTPSTFAPFFTAPTTTTSSRDISKIITSHHFPVNAPDIRFNPEEINISLKAGSPPDISRSQVPVSYQQQSFSEKNTRVSVTTHTTIYKNEKQNRVPLLSTTHQPLHSLLEKTETTLTPKSVVSYGLTHNQVSQVATPTEINYGFSYPQTEESVEYHTEVPPHPYQYQLNIANFRPPTAEGHPYHSTYRAGNKRPHKINFPATTYRNHPAFTSSTKTPIYQAQQTEKPPHLQLPVPLLPTLPPLTFSSPSPFSTRHHVETKRYTSDHQSPPRIIISASASVSDNNGRRLNYSLGTIGAGHILGSSPASYDDYKEEDVISDPFYHDVPKLKKTRRKRDVDDDVIRSDQEAEDLLRYLFNWYKKREEKLRLISIPVTADDISQINDQLAPIRNEETSTLSDIGYEQIFRKILLESEENKYDKIKTKDKDDHETFSSNEDIASTLSTIGYDDEGNVSTTLLTTTEISMTGNKKKSRRKSYPQNETFNEKQNNENQEFNKLHVRLQLTSKNHTRRSGRLSPRNKSSTRSNDYDSQNDKITYTVLNDNRLYKQNSNHQKPVRKIIDEVSEFQDTSYVEFNTESTLQTQDIGDGTDTSMTTNTETTEATIIPDDSSNFTHLETVDDELIAESDQITTQTTLIPTTTEVIRSERTQSILEYEYENVDTIYEDLSEDFTTPGVSSTDLKTTNFIDTTITTTVKTDTTTTPTDKTDVTVLVPEKTDSTEVFTEITDDFVTLTEKSNFEVFQPETHSLSGKEWNTTTKFDSYSSIKETRKFESFKNDKLDITHVKNIDSDNKPKTEYPPLTIPDYVDDNYEPSTYQIDTPVDENQELTTKKEVEVTTNAVATDFDTVIDTVENATETINDDIRTITTNFPTTFITTSYPELTTLPLTNTPTVTTSNTETTLITEGILTEGTTERNVYVTETNLPSTFTTSMTTVTASATETNLIVDITQPVTEITTTPSSTTSIGKKTNKNEYSRHRFGSYSNRKRERGQSKFKNEQLKVLSTTSSNKNDNKNSTILEETKSSINVNFSSKEPITKVELTTLPTEKELETKDLKLEVSLTDAPLIKSANPTKSKHSKIILSTTPLTKVVRIDIRKDGNDRKFIFNCFNKKLHRFYSDPRDCRLFHYCTLGYTKNQLVDMKFVCDLGTYYDEDNFICTKVKPFRCR